MKIVKYQKLKGNEYKVITDTSSYVLYDDIIIKYELLLKTNIDNKLFDNILKENNLLKAYYVALKLINIKLRCELELKQLLKKKKFNKEEIEYTIARLNKEGYLKHDIYIEAYIHDMLKLYLVGENKIYNDLINKGFKDNEINKYLKNIDKDIYLEKINKYINKKLKSNKKSAQEFKKKTLNELINKGFNKSDILIYLDNINIEFNEEEINKIITMI